MPILEVCVDSVESAIEAEKGGANRLELCANLIIGGTTPDLQLFKAVKEVVNIPIHILMRPRFGDFCYTSYEIGIIKEGVKMFIQEGADGIVLGALLPNGSLDLDTLKILIRESGTAHVVLHRCFDMCNDPFVALNQAKSIGIQTILTSGQRDKAIEGKELLKQLTKEAKEDITLLIGSGVNHSNVNELYRVTGNPNYHLSASEFIESSMVYRNPNVSMGLPVMSEYQIQRTCANLVREVKEIQESFEAGE